MGGAIIAGGFASLGRAHGTITIDTSDFRRAEQEARRFGGVAEGVFRDAFQGVDTTFRVLPTRFQQLNSAIQQTQVQLVALTAASALLLRNIGRQAGSLEESQILLEGMVGSETRAVRVMEQLRKEAARAGLPFSDMLGVATQLLPTLKGNTEELSNWFDIVRRVASLNQGPRGGLEGAAFSIREALVSRGTDLISLAERFNISRHEVREALKQTGGDLAAALDIVLTKMGVTTETADKMGKTFNASLRVARDSALNLLAQGLTPVLQVLTPILQSTSDWLSHLQQVDPVLGNIAAAMTVFTAGAAPLLLLLNQIVLAVEALKRLGLLSGLLKLGARGLFAGAVTFGTVEGAQAVGQATGNKALQEVTVTSVIQTLGKLVYNIQYYASTWLAQVGKFFLDAVSLMNDGFIALYNSFITAARFLQSILPDWLDRGGWEQEIERLTKERDAIAEISESQKDLGNDIVRVVDEFQMGLYNKIAAALGEEPIQAPSQLGLRKIGLDTGPDLTDDMFKEIHRWAEGVQTIERNAASARLAATQNFEQQRSQVIAQYERSIVREAEDFALQRARSEQDHYREISDLREEAADREAKWWEDLQERIEDLQEDSDERIEESKEDSNERIAEIEERYRREREQAEEDHRDRLLEAAGRLDAAAVLAEQRRYNRETRNREETFQESIADEKEKLQERLSEEQENLEERIKDEREAHQERIEEAREADAERLADLQEAQALQRAREDEDRAIRLQRQKEDHELQLAQMAAAHAAQIAQINQEEADELKAHNDAHIKRMLELGYQSASLEAIQKGSQDRIVENWKRFWDALEEQFPDRLFGPDPRPPGWSPGGGFQQGPTTPGTPTFPGGFYPQTAPAGASTQSIIPALQSMTSGQWMQDLSRYGLVPYHRGTEATPRVNNITVSEGAIKIQVTPNMDPRVVAEHTRRELERLLEEELQ